VTTLVHAPRWVRRDARIYSYGMPCSYCGTHWGGYPNGCPVATCLACDTPQCLGNGLGRGTCGVCYLGLLPGWSGSNRGCGYKGCHDRAIAMAPRMGHVCASHALRAKHSRTETVAEYIVQRLAERDSAWILATAPLAQPTYGYVTR